MECTVNDLLGMVGKSACCSRWFRMTQEMIDVHAELVEDRQFIHVDPVRAAKTPLGGSVAHGFLTLSMLSAMAYDAQPRLAGEAHSVNYGFNRLRFLAPVRPGSRIRGCFVLQSVEERIPGEITLTWSVEVEIEDHPKPALAAEWINRHYVAGDSESA